MEDGGGPEVTFPTSLGHSFCGDEVFPTPSDAAELMDQPDVTGPFEPLEGEDGMADDRTDGMQETADLTGGIDDFCGSVPAGYKKRQEEESFVIRVCFGHRRFLRQRPGWIQEKDVTDGEGAEADGR